MGFWNQLGHSLMDAVDTVMEKNRKNAQNNRLRLVMKHETDNITRAYIALGKRYYKELQYQCPDEAAQRLCEAVEESSRRLEKARSRLIALNRQEWAKKEQEQPLSESAPAPVAEQPQPDCGQEPEAADDADVPDAQKEAADETERLIPHLPEDDRV